MINQINQALNTKPQKQIGLWLGIFFFSIPAGLLILLVFAMLGYQLLYLHRAYPGVSILGMEVGGLTKEEVIESVDSLALQDLSRQITIETSQESWTFTGAELGMWVDAAATADQVFAVGRRGNLLADMSTQFSLLFNPVEITPVIRYDTGPTNEVLQRLSNEIAYPPQNARLEINAEGAVSVTPAQRGRRLHVGATRPLIEAAVLGHSPPLVSAFTQEVLPPIPTEQVEPLRTQAQAFLSRPLIFRLSEGDEKNEWTIAPEKLITMLMVAERVDAGGRTQLLLALERDLLSPFVEELAIALEREPRDARLAFDDDLEQLTVVEPSLDGRELDIETTYQRVEQAVAQGASMVPLPVVLHSPNISSNDLDSLGIETTVSESTSYFSGSSDGRMRNIALAASKFDGVIIPPGEMFSFNEHLGPVTKESGFDESLIIYGDRTTVGIGGGVCQVSTTAFRTAFFGGFELVERWAHGYRVSWYETRSAPGLDATIYTPDVDLKFRNDSEHHLLIHTHTDLEAGTVTFKFYGTPTDREVIVSEPVVENITKPPPPAFEEVNFLAPGARKQIDWAKEGMDVTVTRTVKSGDTVLHSDTIVSNYRPWRAVYQVGIDKNQPKQAPRLQSVRVN